MTYSFKVLRDRLFLGLGVIGCLFSTILPARAVDLDNLAMPIPTAMTASNQRGQQLLQQGQQFYQGGQYQQAKEQWQAAADFFVSQQQPQAQALSLSYFALAAQALGELASADQAIATALELASPSRQHNPSLSAQIWNTRGSIFLAQGQAEEAVEAWQNSQQGYQTAGDRLGSIGAQLNEMQALQVLGYFRQAKLKAGEIQGELDQTPDSELKIFALRNFGNLLQITGTLDAAAEQLEAALDLARQRHHLALQSQILNDLGNVARQQSELESLAIAEHYYQQAATIAPDPSLRMAAKLNQLTLLIAALDTEPFTLAPLSFDPPTDTTEPDPIQPESNEAKTADLALMEATPEDWEALRHRQIITLLAEMEPELGKLGLSRANVEVQVNWAMQLLKLQRYVEDHAEDHADELPEFLEELSEAPLLTAPRIAEHLARSIKQAQQLRDVRSESFATGILGSVYENHQRWQEAKKLTEKALILASQINAGDLLYRWQWQLGRVVRESGEGDRQGSIDAYKGAIQTLGKIRGDLLATNPEFQLSFRDGIEPVYRELVALLLQPDATFTDLEQARDLVLQTELETARKTIEELQRAELEDYFRSACIDLPEVNIDRIDPKAAVIYPIILGDRLAVIRALPDQPLQHHIISLSKTEIDSTLENLLQSLNPAFDDQYRLGLSKTVYDWIIAPLADDLEGIDTLVFVLDGFLRNIPMAVLHDGEQYLVEKYSLAIAPGLQLVDPRTIDRQRAQVLALGLSQSRSNFPALPGVKAELEAIAQQVPTLTILDESFTQKNLRKEILATPFPILHIATHGQFSSNFKDTFLLTWDSELDVKDFQSVIDERAFVPKQPIELLVLSACETAAGDKYAVLGLAGFAVKSGARSTIATLWSVSDRSTSALMGEFYETFIQNPQMSRSEALRQAQLSLLNNPEYQHPFYWSPFILVGNWL